MNYFLKRLAGYGIVLSGFVGCGDDLVRTQYSGLDALVNETSGEVQADSPSRRSVTPSQPRVDALPAEKDTQKQQDSYALPNSVDTFTPDSLDATIALDATPTTPELKGPVEVLDYCKQDGWKPGTTYVLKGPLEQTIKKGCGSWHCLYLGGAKRVTIDCQGHEIVKGNSNAEHGIAIVDGIETQYLQKKPSVLSGIVIKNCRIKGFEMGIEVGAHGVTVAQNNIVNFGVGIFIGGDYNLVTENIVDDGIQAGIKVQPYTMNTKPEQLPPPFKNRIEQNKVGNVHTPKNYPFSGGIGISEDGQDTVIIDNDAASNDYGIDVDGLGPSLVHNTTMGNFGWGIGVSGYAEGVVFTDNVSCNNKFLDFVKGSKVGINGTGNTMSTVENNDDSQWPIKGLHYQDCPKK